MRMRVSIIAFMLATTLFAGVRGTAAEPFKVAVLKFGTVNWVMDVVRHHRLDEQNGFKLDLLPLASKNATSIALLGGEADAIVTDWFWVLRQRAEGRDFVTVPYSRALGAIMVAKKGAIKSLSDLKGKRIGVAGGPLDKSWLLVQARAKALGAGDLTRVSEPVFAAPPLLNEEMTAGRLDAVLNFWPFAARLEGKGFQRLVGVTDLLTEFGIERAPPLIGFVFSEAFADRKSKVVSGFVRALKQANALLAKSDEEWRRLRPLMKARSDAEFEALKAHYRAGILTSWGPADQKAARRLFETIAKLGWRKTRRQGHDFRRQAVLARLRILSC